MQICDKDASVLRTGGVSGDFDESEICPASAEWKSLQIASVGETRIQLGTQPSDQILREWKSAEVAIANSLVNASSSVNINRGSAR